VVSFTSLSLYTLQEGFRYPLNRRLPATHTRGARFVKGKNTLPLSVIELRFLGFLARSLDTTPTSLPWLPESQKILLKTNFTRNERNCLFQGATDKGRYLCHHTLSHISVTWAQVPGLGAGALFPTRTSSPSCPDRFLEPLSLRGYTILG
jgi:hypothetical protein